MLALDRPDRKIYTYITNKTESAIVKNSFITNTHYKISVFNSVEETVQNNTNVVLLNIDDITENEIKNMSNTANLFVLLKDSRNLYLGTLKSLGFKIETENETLIILKK